MKQRIVSILLLTILFISSIVSFLPQQVQANATYVPWYNSSWLYRKSFNITGSADGTQTNYQLKVYCYYGAGTDTGFVLREPTSGNYVTDAGTNTTTIIDAALTSTVDSYYIGAKVYNVTRALWSVVTAYTASTKTLTISPAIAAQVATDSYYLSELQPVMYFNSKCQTDFDDIRFTQSNGTTLLDYWIESYVASTSAIIWVEFNTLYAVTLSTPNNTFWVYYGNAAATTASNIGNTFIFGDDFDRANNAVVGNGWVETETDASFQISSNTLLITATGAGGISSCIQTLPAFVGTSYKTVTKGKVSEALSGVRFDVAYAGYNISSGWSPPVGVPNGYLFLSTTPAWITVATYVVNVYDVVTIRGTSGVANIDIGLLGTPSLINQGVSASGASTISFGGLGHVVTGTGTIDYVFVQKFTTNEPRWSTFTTEVSLGPTQTIQDVAVFKSYLKDDDWLFAIRYLDVYYPYFDTADIRQYFVFQLLNLSSTVIAQTVVNSWGNKVGCIYLNPTIVASLEWGSAYTVRMYALFSGNPSHSWTLSADDWQGSDLTYLDSWVLSSASVIEDYYSATSLDLTVDIEERGTVLNAAGAAIFNVGITGLSTARPELFQIYSSSATYDPNTYTQTYRQSLSNWQTHWGIDGTVMLTRIGNLIGVQGNIIAIILLLSFLVIVVITAFPMGHTTSANVLTIMILFAGAYLGLDVIWLAGLTIFSGFLLVKQFWIDKGT